MARKKGFLDGLVYKRIEINPDDVVYRKGRERPSDEEIIKEVEKQEFKNNSDEIYMSGAIIVLAVSEVVFQGELSFPILLGLGPIVGTVLFYLDRWIERKIKNSKRNEPIGIPSGNR